MNGWSEGLRQELLPDVRVIVIEPGAVATELTDHITDDETKRWSKQFVEGLAITAEDIAEVIAFAVSPPRRDAQRDPRTPDGAGLKGTPAMTTTLTLNNGVELPALGLGVFQTPADETRDAVRAALDTGYRHIDTAAAYGNEREVGEAVRASGVDRSEVFLETKIWISDYGYDETLHGFEKSAAKLGVDQIDLLILHQALPSAFDRTLEAYRALETLLADGKVRAIGVSNFMVDHLTTLLDRAGVVPAVNQIEVHPYFVQPEVQAFGAEHGILTQAWSPIGGITFYRERRAHQHPPGPGDRRHRAGARQDTRPGHAAVGDPARALGHPEVHEARRIAENIDVFDFELTADEMAAIDALDTGRRGGPEPEVITLEAFGREIPEA